MEKPTNNQLQLIVKNSGLETTKSQYILEKFTNYFEIASEWEKKARNIVVANENDKAEMQMARAGRLFLREKRIAIEKARVELKEQALREGKAIDGIANILKALIVPIEEYLEKQEKFVEIKEKELAEKKRIEDEKRVEEERLAKEEADRKEQERIRVENLKLKQEAEEREKKMEAERIRAEKTLAEEKARAEAKIKAEKEASERLQAEIKAKAEAERIRAEKSAGIEREKIEKKLIEEKEERERIQKLIDEQIECPFCHKRFYKSQP